VNDFGALQRHGGANDRRSGAGLARMCANIRETATNEAQIGANDRQIGAGVAQFGAKVRARGAGVAQFGAKVRARGAGVAQFGVTKRHIGVKPSGCGAESVYIAAKSIRNRPGRGHSAATNTSIAGEDRQTRADRERMATPACVARRIDVQRTAGAAGSSTMPS
jgi:hypothetical protein